MAKRKNYTPVKRCPDCGKTFANCKCENEKEQTFNEDEDEAFDLLDYYEEEASGYDERDRW